MEQPDLSIVIVSWNTRELLRDCLASVFAEPSGLKLEVFVTDNASADNSAQMVRESFPQVQVVENEINLGFAAANNRVFPLCHAEKILLLNSDTVVKNDALRVLFDFLDAHLDVAAVAPKLEQSNVDIIGCGRRVTLRTTINHWLFLSRLFPHVKSLEGIYHYAGVHDVETREVDWISGACLMVRRSVIDQVGPMSERWFMYAEDQEWCARIQFNGWKMFLVPTAVVEHRHGASGELNTAISLQPIQASRELFIELNNPSPVQLWLHDAVRAVGMAIRALAYFLQSFLAEGDKPSLLRRKGKTFWFYTRATVLILTGCAPR
jgi:N-acetylglucosaminyl-diphospho-decaprenol L-rhamnosyltransferase